MTQSRLRIAQTLTMLAVCTLAAAPVVADKPEWAGKGKGHDKGASQGKGKGHAERGGHGDDRAGRGREGGHFSQQHRVVVHEYYQSNFSSRGRCPPGLAKKRNGCMPPGQAKKWRYGRALPRDVIYYEVPPALVVLLPPPPAGRRYVRVAADILLIAVGTGMVIDAIEDLGRL
ncbi:MAG: RcnB family protein [Burkholderiales bacterium]